MKAKLTNDGLILFSENEAEDLRLKAMFTDGMKLYGKYLEGKKNQRKQLLMLNNTIGWIKTTTRKARFEKTSKKKR